MVSGLLLPMLLEALASEVAISSYLSSCRHSPCLVPLVWWHVNTASYALYVTALSSFLQGVVLIPLSGLCDLEFYRYGLLLLATVVAGGAYGMLLWGDLAAVSVLGILGSFAASAMTAYTLALIPVYARINRSDGYTLRLSNVGSALSLLSSTLVGLLGVGLTRVVADPLMGMRAGISAGGLFCLLAGIVGWFLLRHRRGTELPAGQNAVAYSISSVFSTLRLSLRLSQLSLAQLAFFFLSKGTNTAGTVTMLIAIKELKAPSSAMFLIVTATPLACSLGIVVTKPIQRLLGLKWTIFLFSCITCITMFSNVIGKFNPYFGMRSVSEIAITFFFSSFFYGTVAAQFVALVATFSPKGRDSQLFTINTLLCSGTTWIGSVVIAAIIDSSDSIRDAGYFPIVVTLCGIFTTYLINVKKGTDQATTYAVATPAFTAMSN